MKRLAVALILICTLVAASGQGARYVIRNYDLLTEINLNGSTWAMTQDSAGVLYFGADFGCAVYNGSYWQLFSHSQSIVRSLFTDASGKIWYGGFDDFGYIRRDLQAGYVFHPITGQLPDADRRFGDIWSITEAGNRLFFQSKSRLFIYENNRLLSVPVADSYHRGAAIHGDYLLNQTGIGLTAHRNGTLQPLPNGAFFKDKIVSCLLELPGNKILIGDRYTGLSQYDPVTGSIQDAFPLYPETNRTLAAAKIYHALRLPGNLTAVATLSGGTFILNPEGRILKVLNRDHGLRDNVNYWLGLSGDHTLWICTSNGISSHNIHSPFTFWDYTSGIDGVVLDITPFQKSVYVATLTGLYSIQSDPGAPDQLTSRVNRLIRSETWSLLPFVQDRRELLLAGTGNGVYQIRNGQPSLIRSSELVLKLIQPARLQDYVISLHGDNIDLFNFNGSEFEFVRNIGNLFTGMRTAAEDTDGNLWIGTRSSGIIRIPVESLVDGVPRSFSYTIDSILTDVIEYSGQVVFSNRNGLFTYHEATGRFEPYQPFGQGSIPDNRMISTLKKDSRGNVWIGGEDILLARPDGSYISDKLNFQQLKDVFSAFVFLHADQQKTWIGGNSGVYLYDGTLTRNPQSQLLTLINRVELPDGATLYLNANSPPEEAGAGEIDLTQRNSRLAFWFSLPGFENEEATVYSWKLEGYLNEWSEWSTDRQVTFSNLRPAEYTLLVRGRNIYNQTGQPATFVFRVPSPWYLSLGMILLYLAATAMVVYFIASGLSRIKLRKQLRIEDLIRKRIQESNRAYLNEFLTDTDAGLPERKGEGAPIPPVTPNRTENRDQQFLSRALRIIEVHMGNHDLNAGMFCREMGMSQARVYRKLVALTDMSIAGFIRNIRLKKAAQMLAETDLTIAEIAYRTGFSSPGYFTKCFNTEFGINPRDFGKRRHAQ